MIDGQIIGQNVYFRGKNDQFHPIFREIHRQILESSVNLQVFECKWPIFDGSFFLGNFLFIRTSYIQKYKYQLKENPFLSKYFYFCSEPEI